MAHTNRNFDDQKILAELLKRKGLDTGGAEVTDLGIVYDPPFSNGVNGAVARVEVEIRLSAEEADAILLTAQVAR